MTMLRIADRVLTADFLKKAKGGLLLISDERKQTTRLGWIKEAAAHGKGIRVRLGLTVVQKHGGQKWKRADGHTFDNKHIGTFTAMKQCDGFICTDTTATQSTFRIYPASSKLLEPARDHRALIKFGETLQ